MKIKILLLERNGSLIFGMSIENVQAIVTSRVLLIGNSEFKRNQEIQIAVDDINDIEICSEIILEMNGNYTIFIAN